MAIGCDYNKIRQIGEHHVILPDCPKDKRDILFIDNKKEDAYWHRIEFDKKESLFLDFIPYFTKVDQDATLYDQDGILISLNKEDSTIIRRVYEREMNRRANGVFFRNGNDIEYLTGNHYFTLQYAKMYGVEGGYGSFWKFQADIMYLIRHCWLSPDRLGCFFAKPKKTGVTQLMTGYYLNKSTMTREQQMGIMSKKGDDAINTNMMFYFHSFDALPAAFKPKWSNRADRDGMINFAERAYRGKQIQKASSKEDFLNTKVFAAPTKPAAFDSPLIHDEWIDEMPKIYKESKVSPKEVFDTNKEAVKIQSRFNGRVWATSYANEENDIGHTETMQIYFDSKLSTVKYGRTTSGLICHHIPAYMANIECIDKYGNCNEISATELTIRERDKLKKDKKAYQAALRQYSFDEKEYWGSGGFSTVFDTAYLSECKFELEKELRESVVTPYVLGNFEWEEIMWNIGKHDARRPGAFCSVRFVPLTENELLSGKVGKVKMYRDIHRDDKNLPMRLGRDEIGNVLPPARFKYFSGIDPTSYADAEDIESPSMQSSFTMNIHDDYLNTSYRDVVTRILMCEYDARPDLAEEAYQDVVKEIIYFGKLVVVEANQPHVYTRLMNEGLGNYVVIKHKDGFYQRWNTTLEPNEYTGIRRTKNAVQNDVLETIIELIKHYTFKPTDIGQIEYAKKIKSLKLLEHLCNFDVTNTRKYDTVLALGYTLLAYETYRAELAQVKDEVFDDMAMRAMLSAMER